MISPTRWWRLFRHFWNCRLPRLRLSSLPSTAATRPWRFPPPCLSGSTVTSGASNWAYSSTPVGPSSSSLRQPTRSSHSSACRSISSPLGSPFWRRRPTPSSSHSVARRPRHAVSTSHRPSIPSDRSVAWLSHRSSYCPSCSRINGMQRVPSSTPLSQQQRRQPSVFMISPSSATPM